jgi:aldose 1-epimerase
LPNRLRSILLRDGDITVGIAPDCGGALARFEVRTHHSVSDVLRPSVKGSHAIPCSLAASCFPLVPYCGRLREGRFQFENRRYQYPLNALPERHSSHGEGWGRPWTLSKLDRRSATMSLEADGSAPFQYHCDQSVSISDNRVSIVLSVRNLSVHRIPVGLGLHPYFANRNEARIKARLPTRWRWDQEMMPVSMEANPNALTFLQGQPVNELSVCAEYADWDGKASIEWPARNLLVELETYPPLIHVVMWMPSGESFFCFEPISHATDALNMQMSGQNPEGYFVLDPNATAEQRFDFVISPLRSRATL